MYNLQLHAHQAMGYSLVFVSVSETDDELHTEVLFTSNAQDAGELPGEDYNSLETFLNQTLRGIVKALSIGEAESVRLLESMSQSTVGGGAPGHPGQTERSEDDHA